MARSPIDVPIVCTLDGNDMGDRLAEWRAILSSATANERQPRRATFTFAVDPVTAGRIADVCAREVGCCAFFEFHLGLAAGEMQLDIAVPVGGDGALDSLTGVT